VSHYLWRYYTLGHKHLLHNIQAIYTHLASIRRGVAPLSYVTLVQEYENILIQRGKDLARLSSPDFKSPPVSPSKGAGDRSNGSGSIGRGGLSRDRSDRYISSSLSSSSSSSLYEPSTSSTRGRARGLNNNNINTNTSITLSNGSRSSSSSASYINRNRNNSDNIGRAMGR